MADAKLYQIKGEEGYNFIAGRTRHDEQVLMGVHDRRLVGVFFQLSGDFIRTEERPQPQEALTRLNRLEAELALWPLLDIWKVEIGFTPCDIHVRQFHVPEFRVGIAELPESYQAFLADPATVRDEEYDTVRDAIMSWQATNSFVLWWRKEYWMNAQGEVTDT
jgi:hypothetical protein